MARRRKSRSGIRILFWVIIILVILIIFLQDKSPIKQGNLSKQAKKIKNYIFKNKKNQQTFIGNKKITAELYFIKYVEKNEKLVLVKVERNIPLSDTPLTDTINLLLEGPNPSEEKKGITSVFWSSTKLRKAKIKNNIAYLDFNSEIETGVGISMLQARLYQIVYTATQFPEVKSVKILINGKKKNTFSTEGLSIKNPLARLNRKPIF